MAASCRSARPHDDLRDGRPTLFVSPPSSASRRSTRCRAALDPGERRYAQRRGCRTARSAFTFGRSPTIRTRAALNGGKHDDRHRRHPPPASVEVLYARCDAERCATGRCPTVEGTVDVHEALGADWRADRQRSTASRPVTALTSPEAHFEPGQAVRLALHTGRTFLYFSPRSAGAT